MVERRKGDIVPWLTIDCDVMNVTKNAVHPQSINGVKINALMPSWKILGWKAVGRLEAGVGVDWACDESVGSWFKQDVLRDAVWRFQAGESDADFYRLVELAHSFWTEELVTHVNDQTHNLLVPKQARWESICRWEIIRGIIFSY